MKIDHYRLKLGFTGFKLGFWGQEIIFGNAAHNRGIFDKFKKKNSKFFFKFSNFTNLDEKSHCGPPPPKITLKQLKEKNHLPNFFHQFVSKS